MENDYSCSSTVEVQILKKNPVVLVDVWNYKDKWLQYDQLNGMATSDSEISLDIETSTCAWLQTPGESGMLAIDDELSDEWIKFVSTKNVPGKLKEEECLAISTITGERMRIDTEFVAAPGGRFLIYFDSRIDAYCSYDLVKREKSVLTKDIRTNWRKSGFWEPGEPRGIAGWSKSGK
ncbi:hypothetical protein [Chitinophaga pinensis]|uniref:Uncharacterized protein n=1 Tax=Chitinophaga pinensis TaxID=79329 RepID=A0A5C6LRA2_9BACT|nr:hypothetical protein [Chitinophaga pinensis]TWV96182.1 hypothetical protein FEF09_23630 [Chitinophaga pinensis]